MFQDGVDAFVDRIKNRAVEKKKEEAEREAPKAEISVFKIYRNSAQKLSENSWNSE